MFKKFSMHHVLRQKLEICLSRLPLLLIIALVCYLKLLRDYVNVGKIEIFERITLTWLS